MEDLFLSMFIAMCIMVSVWFLCCVVVLLFQLFGWLTTLILVLFAGLTTVTYLYIKL